MEQTYKYTMNDIWKIAPAMEAWLLTTGEEEFKIRRNFDPRGMSHTNWKSIVFPVVKRWYKDMTEENFKWILDQHRELYKERDAKNLSLRRTIPDVFKYMGKVRYYKDENGAVQFEVNVDRVFPLSGERYNNIQKHFNKKYKNSNVVFFYNGKVKAIERSEADSEIMKKAPKPVDT